MTKIFFTKKNDKFVALKITGHTGKDVNGKDVLCAAISATSQMAVCGITEVAKVKADVEIKEGFLRLYIENPTSETQLILETLYETLLSICENEKKYVKLEVKNEN